MSLSPPPGISLRPYLPRDLPQLVSVFRDAVENLAGEDYDADQCAAWTSAVDDEAKFGARLEQCVTLVAEAGTEVAGFIALKNNEKIEYLYVAPRFARRGVARFLVSATEMLAQGRKAGKITVAASDTAQPLFIALGYTPVQRNTVSLGGEWLANTTMEKELNPQTSETAQ